MSDKVKQWQKEGEQTTLSVQERTDINSYFTKYQEDLRKCMEDESNKEVEINTDKFTEETLGKLMDCNEWTVEQCVALMEFIN